MDTDIHKLTTLQTQCRENREIKKVWKLSEVSENFQIFINLYCKYSIIFVNFSETHFSKCKPLLYNLDWLYL